MDNDTIEEMAPNAGVPVAGTDETVDDPETSEATEEATTPKLSPSVERTEDDIKVDDNLNFKYVLKNGKVLDTSVKKPSLKLSTELSDNMVRFTQDADNGGQMMMLNNMGIYAMVMRDLIGVIIVDDKPLHSATFDNLSSIGMTKAELDDYMNIITTFYLS